jgi:hypothetical protein
MKTAKPEPRKRVQTSMRSLALAGLCAGLFMGCATTRIDAQWVDPQFARQTLSGTKVLVECGGADTTVRQLCSEQLAMQLSLRGVLPLTLDPPTLRDEVQQGLGDAALLERARSLGAQTVLRASVAPAVQVASPGPTIGLGVGGFSGGRGYGYGGSGTGVGMGIGFPVGGGTVNTGYGAKGSLIDVATGRPIWSANASTPATADAGEQVQLLTQALVEAATQAGLF